MLTLNITASTTTEEIEAAIPFVDMRKEAIERRDDALAVIDEQGDEEVLELHEYGDVLVLYSPIFGYALVNENTTGVGDSLLIDNGKADSAEHAFMQWKKQTFWEYVAEQYSYCFRDMGEDETAQDLAQELEAGGLLQWGDSEGVPQGNGIVLWNQSRDKRFLVVEVQGHDDSGYFAIFDDMAFDSAGNTCDGDKERALEFAKEYRAA